MKEFLKENGHSILLAVLAGLVLILLGRLVVAEFSHNAICSHLTTRQARVRCLSYLGWQVDETSETEDSVYIPDALDPVWSRYNEIQKMSGFDLTAYRGKRVKHYSFRVLNFPGMDQAEVFVNLLVYEGVLIGGDCMSAELDGFMLPIDIRSVVQR